MKEAMNSIYSMSFENVPHERVEEIKLSTKHDDFFQLVYDADSWIKRTL